MTLIEKRQAYAKLVSDLQGISDRADFTAEDEQEYETCYAEVEKLEREIARGDDLEKRQTMIAAATSKSVLADDDSGQTRTEQDAADESRNAAFDGWLTRGMPGLSGEEQRALQVDIDASGGYIVAPQMFVTQLIQAVDNLVFMRGLATVHSVPNADSLGAPSLDNDPADPTWTSEILTGAADSTMDFGKRELNPHPLAQSLRVSRTLLRKSAIGAEALVRERLAYKLAVVEETAFMTGTGANQPLGVFTASASGIDTGRDVATGNTTTAVTVDGLKEAQFSMKQQYWGRLQWVFHRDTVKMIHKLKDGEGQYLLQPNIQAGAVNVLLGFPINMSEYAPNTFTAGLYVGMLGDFSQYWIADSLNVEIQRLDELYAATNQVGFISRIEADGMPVLAEAFARVTLAP